MISQSLKVEAANALHGGDLAAFQRIVVQNDGLLDTALGSGNWLHVAARSDHPEIGEWLIEQGLDPKFQELRGTRATPLFQALTKENLAIGRVLLQHGADPNVDRLVLTPLCGTVKHRSLEAIKLLEEFGVDLHAVFQDEIANRPINALSTAIGNGKDDVVEYLKSKGCEMPE